MSILTERRTWKRKRDKRVAAILALKHLTPEQARNVRAVVHHLGVVYGSPVRLARAMGLSVAALEKARGKARPATPRLVLILSRITGVTFDDILEGRWQRHACPDCGHVGAHKAVR